MNLNSYFLYACLYTRQRRTPEGLLPFVEEWSWGPSEAEVERLCIRSLDLLLGPKAENAEIFKNLGVYEVLRLRDLCSEKDSSLQEETERIVFAILALFPPLDEIPVS
eukprot:GHVP01049448.1.p3 GENE.GHVP01049448.1~~GHVP01049448.1.p3  ORF type:complete len:108 (-),score=29.17 GHVP01049448.1:384-707(-)